MNKLKVVFLSDWAKNPYKDLLSDALTSYGLDVVECEWSTFFLLHLFKSSRPNILHLHTLHPFLRSKTRLTHLVKLFIFISQLTILRVVGTETVWTVHEWTDKLTGGKDEIPPSSCILLGKCLKTIIVHCQSTKTQIEDAFQLKGKGKVIVVPHGNYIDHYDNSIDKNQARESLKIANDKVTFLLFGSIYRYKGVLEAIEAFKGLNQEAASLIIAGKPGQKGLEAEISNKIKDHNNVVFIPKRIPDEDVQTLMNAADCVLVPYTVFTTSGIAILAMSFGRACIVPNMGFFSDVLSSSGAYLYDTSDKIGLANAMSQT